MSHGSKLAIGWIAVIQLISSLVFLGVLLLDGFAPATGLAEWFTTDAGQWVVAGFLSYFAVVALVTWLIILFVPTTTKTLTLARSNSSELTISKKGVEHSLAEMVTHEYPQLTNTETHVKMRRLNGKTKAKISATVTDENGNYKALAQQIEQAAEHNLTQLLGVTVARITVRLRPYVPGEDIEVA